MYGRAYYGADDTGDITVTDNIRDFAAKVNNPKGKIEDYFLTDMFNVYVLKKTAKLGE